MVELWLVFLAGILSSLHCVGMCGPIVAGCITPIPIQIVGAGGAGLVSSRVSAITPHLLYNGGRVISYSIIGTAAGLVGSAALLSPRLQSGFGIVFGFVMVAMALFQMNLYPKRKQVVREVSLAQKIFSSVRSLNQYEGKFLVGFLTPLLPCGLIYGMAAHAATSSSPVFGAIEMGVFALGSVPALLVVGLLSGMIGARIRKLGTTFAALLILVMGLLTIARGLGIYHGVSVFQYGEHLCGFTK
ncbi:MAG: sulfite exporter TauE/SafE family protein [Ignavibacteriota bacterium]